MTDRDLNEDSDESGQHDIKCPCCHRDLSPYDIVTRNEHITMCLEGGAPSVVDYQNGQLVIVKDIPLEKRRKICPLCSKTFQNIHLHFKKCAIKYDLTPDMMQEHWLNLNKAANTDKVFPREMLEDFVANRVKDGRLGEQVEYARALLETMPESTRRKNTSGTMSDNSNSNSNFMMQHLDAQMISNGDRSSSKMTDGGDSNSLPGVNQVFMQQQQQILPQQQGPFARFGAAARRGAASQFKTELELANSEKRHANIQLRIDRELSAASRRRYESYLLHGHVGQSVLSANDNLIWKYTDWGPANAAIAGGSDS